MDAKGREFNGFLGGANYNCWAVLFGFTKRFYRKALGKETFRNPIKVVDLGCGSGSLTLALAERMHAGSELYGVDISVDQLNYANRFVSNYACKLKFLNSSMDQLPFNHDFFDWVITSMALHETPPEVRRRAIKEAARVLKGNGKLLLVDWSRPKFGLWGIVWFPLVYFKKKELKDDNWNNAYKDICEAEGLELIEDCYINSIARRQVFQKKLS